MDLYQSYIHKSRYARFLPEKKRREHWPETVARYIETMRNHINKNHNEAVSKKDWDELEQAILDHEIMPSMRAMMTAGPALLRDNTAGYNCSYVPVDDPKAFDEAMHILMCGTGVGFSVERQYVNRLPEVPEKLFPSDLVIKVRDSKEGWSKAFRMLISMLYAGEIPTWDVSKVREAGAPLKTFGGRASGPGPLVDLFKFTIALFRGAAGRRLTSIECHDLMCKVGEVVVVGGVRRSAMISLSNLSDDRMRHAKIGSWWETHVHRALSNNSAVYNEKPDVGLFMEEWKSLYESKSGERGIFNRDASRRVVEKSGRRDPDWDWGTNPCCFSGDMLLSTKEGARRFDELAKREFVDIVNVNGDITRGKVWCSGDKETVFVTYEKALGRNPIQVTPDHIFMLVDGSECQAKDLKGKQLMPDVSNIRIIDPTDEMFLAGFILGDGALNRLNSDTHKKMEVYLSEKDADIANAYGVPTGVWYSEQAVNVAEKFGLPAKKIGERGFPEALHNFYGLSGLFSANGSVIKNKRIALKSIDKEQLLEVQKVMRAIGIESFITTNKKRVQEFSNGFYAMRESYDLNISRYDSIKLFSATISFAQQYKRNALRELLLTRAPKVKAVKSGPIVPVYDFTEPETHWGIVEGVVVHNSEIILRPNEFCNLTEIVARATDTKQSLERKVRLATILGTVQSSLTHFPYLRRAWTKNTEEERLLGVSMTGIFDCPLINNVSKESEELLEFLKLESIRINKRYAKAMGIPSSAAITCVKPSGTVSQLTDSASGIHQRHDPYYIRRVRGDMKDPLTQFLMSKGVPHEPDVTKPTSTMVFSFPKKVPKNAVCRNDITALEHLNVWLMFQRFWCEHKPSVTISVKEHEWMSVGAWVYDNFDEVSGISFLPYDGGSYRQAPYETIDKDEYDKLVKEFPNDINWDDFNEDLDMVEGIAALACSAGNCDI